MKKGQIGVQQNGEYYLQDRDIEPEIFIASESQKKFVGSASNLRIRTRRSTGAMRIHGWLSNASVVGIWAGG